MLEGHGQDYILTVLVWRLKKKNSTIISSFFCTVSLACSTSVKIKNLKLLLKLQDLFPGRLSLTLFIRHNFANCIWVKVFKNRPSKILRKTAFKKFEVIWSAYRLICWGEEKHWLRFKLVRKFCHVKNLRFK